MSHKATVWAIQQRGLKPATKIVLWFLCDRHNPDFGVVRHERSAGQATGGTGFPAAVGAPAAPEVGPGSARSVQKNFPEAGAAIPARARDKPLEIWFQG